MHVCLSMTRKSGRLCLPTRGPVIFALSVDICTVGRLLGMSYNSAGEPHND